MTFETMPNKQVMTPNRIKMLKALANRKGDPETTAMFFCNKTGCTLESAYIAAERFAQYKLIRFTGGGYFEITDKGREYLEQIAE